MTNRTEWFLNKFLEMKGIEEHENLSRDIMLLFTYLYDFTASEAIGDFSDSMRLVESIEDDVIRNVFMEYLKKKMSNG